MTNNTNPQTTNETQTQNTNIKFPSAETLLSVIQNEYDYEANRKRDIETRGGIFIGLIGAIIGFYINGIDLSYFKKANSNIEILCFILITVLYLLPIGTLMYSLRHFINVLKSKQYTRIGRGGFNETSAQKQNDKMCINLMKSYKAVVDENQIANDEKTLQFDKGIKLFFSSAILLITVYIINQIIKLII